MRASEVLAERWTPIIVRNLLLGCETFSEIAAGAPGISDTLLSQRLRSLEHYEILERHAKPKGRGWLYRLTPAGRELQEVCDALGTWGTHWLDAGPQGLDPGIVLWAVAKNMDTKKFPRQRVVVRFDLRDAPEQKYWLLIQRPAPELCRRHPGFEEDVVVTTETAWLTKWHIGRISLREAQRKGIIQIDGSPAHARAFARCGGQSPFAAISPKVPENLSASHS